MTKLSSHNKDFLPANLLEKFLLLREIGFDAYEIDGTLLLKNHREVEKAARSSGMEFTAICNGPRGWIGDFDEEKRQMALADIESMIQVGVGVGIPGIVLPAAFAMFSLYLPPFAPPRNREGDRAVLMDSLSRLDEICRREGSYIFLEPLLRYQDHMINRLADAQEIIDAGHFKCVKICADFFHMNMEEVDIASSLSRHASSIGHVHLSDSNRLHPGAGHVDFLSGLKALKEAGYAGNFSVECIPAKEKPLETYRDSVKLIRSWLDKAGF